MSKIIVKPNGMSSIYLPTLQYEAMPYTFRGNGIRLKVPFENYIDYLQEFIVPQKQLLYCDYSIYEACLEQESFDTLQYLFLYDTALACLKEVYFCTTFKLHNFNRIEPTGIGVPKVVNQRTVKKEDLQSLETIFDRFNDINGDFTSISVGDYISHPAMSYISEMATTAIGSLQLYDFICV